MTLALYRAAQEETANAQKHAPHAVISVCLSFDATNVSLSVDSGRSRTAKPSLLASVGGGYGLIGMRERVRLAGGSAEAGPTENGWRVTAEICQRTGLSRPGAAEQHPCGERAV